jgi:hypothetical protein
MRVPRARATQRAAASKGQRPYPGHAAQEERLVLTPGRALSRIAWSRSSSVLLLSSFSSQRMCASMRLLTGLLTIALPEPFFSAVSISTIWRLLASKIAAANSWASWSGIALGSGGVAPRPSGRGPLRRSDRSLGKPAGGLGQIAGLLAWVDYRHRYPRRRRGTLKAPGGLQDHQR